MARGKVRWTTRCLFSLQITLYLFLIFVQGKEETDEAYRNGRSLVLEYFLPINLPPAVEIPRGREKRDIEGSGEDGPVFSEINNKNIDSELIETNNSSQYDFETLLAENEKENAFSNITNLEGSGEVDQTNESSYEISSEEEEEVESKENITTTTATTIDVDLKPAIVPKEEIIPSTIFIDNVTTPEVTTAGITEMIFDTSQDYSSEETTSTEKGDTTTEDTQTFTIPIRYGETIRNKFDFEHTTVLDASTVSSEPTTIAQSEEVTFQMKSLANDYLEETSTSREETTTSKEDTSTSKEEILISREESSASKEETSTSKEETSTIKEEASTYPVHVAGVPEIGVTETPVLVSTTSQQTEKSTEESFHTPVVTTESLGKVPEVILTPTEGIKISTKPISTTPGVVVEEIFKETKVAHKSLEALPGNILQKESISLGVDPFPIVTNTRTMESEETLNSSEPKRLGAYIVIGLILLSFSSLVGYITFKKRKMNKKRQEFESRPESHDTEKALLSLNDYKDNSELEENHLKNNEITPIVVKSNTQINKFEKNTNFSSPKNLNTIANEKNIEKDNVLKSTSENLTQVIIEDSPKDLEEEKNVPNTEKLIVRTLIDQDSIPKKPIFINTSCKGYVPIAQDTL